MMGAKSRKLGALFAIGQGLVAAIAPGQSAKLTRKLIDKQFDNADKLTPTPEYLRQIRAMGVGVAAAGVATLVMESAAKPSAETESSPEDPPTDEA